MKNRKNDKGEKYMKFKYIIDHTFQFITIFFVVFHSILFISCHVMAYNPEIFILLPRPHSQNCSFCSLGTLGLFSSPLYSNSITLFPFHHQSTLSHPNITILPPIVIPSKSCHIKNLINTLPPTLLIRTSFTPLNQRLLK